MVKVKRPYLYSDRTRHGQIRYYVKVAGSPKVRIREMPGTAEFDAAYWAARAEADKQADPTHNAEAPVSNTYRWLALQWFKSSAFRQCSARTQYARQRIIEPTWDEPTSKDAKTVFGDFPIHRLDTKALSVLRDRKVGKPEAANNRVRCLRALFKWAYEAKLVDSNPARELALIRNVSEGYHAWTREELAKFENRHPLGTKARLAYALLRYTGVRRSDLVLLGRQHLHDSIDNGVSHRVLKFTVQKGRERRIITLELPVLPELQETLDAGPTGDMIFLLTAYGRPFTVAGFGTWFRERCNEAGLRNCSAHGIRKAAATIAAENGATAHQLMAQYGWLTLKQAEHYTRNADRRRLARESMHLLVDRKTK